ncbi:MAG: 4'-phosphopantetheinyl transferase superfamily protein [Pseudomonadota bacterium]|nr:4'-phosphopantetheinyl transferase superfamily protein [Pseudomonadota bacterium]
MTAIVTTWLLDLEPNQTQAAAYRTLLTADERLRVEHIRRPRDKIAFTARRAQRRQLLACWLGAAPAELVFDENEFGKPALRDAGTVRFNCSSSGGVGLCVVSRDVDLGCDIEQCNASNARTDIAERFFTPAERTALASLAPDQWLAGFFNCWTRKEALLKCLGCGLSGELDDFTVSLVPGAPPAILSHEGYAVAAFRPVAGYEAAVVARSVHPLRLGAPRWWNEPAAIAPRPLAALAGCSR